MSAGLNVSPAQVSRSYHDLSYSKTFDIDAGYIYPVLHDECVPGDVWSIGAEFVVRANPLMTPLLHRLDVKVDYFFIPYRILMGRAINHPEEGEWTDFITGGKDGKSTVTLPRYLSNTNRLVGSVWEALGFPMPASNSDPMPYLMPLDFPRRAYFNIWNEYYRDQDLMNEIDLVNGTEILPSCWEKDYFTSARPWQQKGDPMAFPINLAGSAVFPSIVESSSITLPAGYRGVRSDMTGSMVETGDQVLGIGIDRGLRSTAGSDLGANHPLVVARLNENSLDLTSSSTFDVADLRFIVQAQRWMERNARAGNRYTEFLKAHFGVYPNDARLQRPEYIGGLRSPIVISEVLQTSETSPESPQGNLAGHGITFDSEHVGKYRVEEYGIIMGMFRIMPKPMYIQGINRQWLRQSRFDFYVPEFAHLSEQEIFNEELYSDGDDDDMKIFGFQGRYNEMRFKQNIVTGSLRDTLKFWHMGRIFGSRPILNRDFLFVNPYSFPEAPAVQDNFRKDVFQVPSERGFVVSFGNKLDVMRPIPVDPEPGLLDHI